MAITDPRSIPGLVAWYSAEAEDGYADGVEITQWTDLSGNDNHAVAATAGAAKPLWQATTGPGGGPAIRFAQDGYLLLPSGVMGSAAAGEIMSMAKADTATMSSQGWWHFGTGGLDCHYTYGGNIYDDFGCTERYLVGSPVAPLDAWRRINIWSAPNDWRFEIDGTGQRASVTNTVAWRTQPQIGNGASAPPHSTADFTGHHSCLVLYNRKLTTEERADLTTWMVANPSGGPAPLAINNPADIPGLVAWYAAHDVTGLADGATMGNWEDLSGNGNDAVISGSGPMPSWQANTGPGGVPAIRFPATAQSTTGGYFALPPTLMGGSSAGEVMVNIKADGVNNGLWALGVQGSTNESHYPGAEGFGLQSRVGFTATMPVTEWRTYNIGVDATAWEAWIDGVLQHSVSNPSRGWAAVPLLGVGSANALYDWRYAGHISAFVLYNRKLTTEERSNLAAWMEANPGGIDTAASGPPPVPTNLAVEILSSTSVRLSWAGHYTATGYEVRLDGGAPVDAETLTSHTFTGLTTNQTYTLEVRAKNVMGLSNWAGTTGTPLSVLLRDDFARADSTNVIGTPAVGGPYTVRLGTWGISGGKLYLSAGVTNAHVTFPAAADIDIALTMGLITTGGGVVFRWTDVSNYWLTSVNGTNWGLWRRQAGTFYLVRETSGLSGDRVRVVARGRLIYMLVNGVLRFAIEDQWAGANATVAGFYGGTAATTQRWDDALVTAPLAPPVPEEGATAVVEDQGRILFSAVDDAPSFVYKGRDSKTADEGAVA